ncbi:MAG TPA: hypothetical protein VFA71_01785 [Terriglobales bacterium]|nr:hypothetical protein [Terriglobales bacterium]
MPKITALIHVPDKDRLLEQTLRTLRSCDEVLVIHHGSRKEVAEVARRRGATLKQAIPGVDEGAYAVDAHNPWVLCLLPGESLSKELEASLEHWKKTEPNGTVGYNIEIREQTSRGWRKRPRETRLVNRTCLNWKEALPGKVPDAPELKGSLLRARNA